MEHDKEKQAPYLLDRFRRIMGDLYADYPVGSGKWIEKRHRIEHTDLIAGHPHTDGILVCRVEYVLTGHIRPEPVLEILALFFGGDPVYRKVNGAEPEAFIIKLLRYGKRYICGCVVTLVVIIIDTNNLIHHIAAFHVFTQRVLVTE